MKVGKPSGASCRQWGGLGRRRTGRGEGRGGEGIRRSGEQMMCLGRVEGKGAAVEGPEAPRRRFEKKENERR